MNEEDSQTRLFCSNHPQRETVLRCNRCDKPICPSCAVLTPTGYRCKDCVTSQQKTFETAVTLDYFLAFAAAGVLSFLGSLVVPLMGFFSVFLAPIAGVIIAEVVRWLVRRRRSRALLQVTVFAAVLGGLPRLLFYLLGYLALVALSDQPAVRVAAYGVLDIVWQVVYIFLMTSSLYYRLGGIRVN